MNKNIGTFDRILRVIIGLVLFAVSWFSFVWWLKLLFLAIGIFSIYEALVGWCAFYALIGKNTCPIK